MRYAVALVALCAALLTGCEYKVPVTDQHPISVDSKVLGLWEAVTDDAPPGKEGERMLVLKFSPTEYLIRYPTGKDGLYFRGYAVRIDDLLAVQVQLIGKASEPVVETDRRFHLILYNLDDGVLTLRILNRERVPGTLATGAAIAQAIRDHLQDADLFGEPSRFRKVVKED